MPLFLLWQVAAGGESATYPLLSLGVGGGIAALVISLWRTDRRDSMERYERLAKDSQERYANLAKESNERAAVIAADFKSIVQENTKAMTAMGDRMAMPDDRCALAEILMELLKSNKKINLEP